MSLKTTRDLYKHGVGCFAQDGIESNCRRTRRCSQPLAASLLGLRGPSTSRRSPDKFGCPFRVAELDVRLLYKMNTLHTLVLSCLVLLISASSVRCQSEQERISQLEHQVSSLTNDIKDASSAGFTLFLFGAFCALWAQNSGRSAWLWFFLGVFFHIITVIVLLVKNSSDREPPNSRLFSEGRKL